jgi:multidrug resistance efflux pump
LNTNKQTTIISQTKDEIVFLRNALQSYNQLKKTITEWELKYVLNSSIGGEVSFMQIWSKGQMINPGDIVFTVVPNSLKNYIGKVKAKGQNSGKLKIGQKVNIRLINYPYREYGLISGKVSSISLTPDKEGYLLLNISLPHGLITSYKKKVNFQQEMTGTADIITEDMRLIERLLYQFRDLFQRS